MQPREPSLGKDALTSVAVLGRLRAIRNLPCGRVRVSVTGCSLSSVVTRALENLMPVIASDGEARPPGADVADVEAQWTTVRLGFVDDPAAAVAAADELVGGLLRQLAALREADRMLIEREWRMSESPTTEVLRRSLQRYGELIDQLGAELRR